MSMYTINPTTGALASIGPPVSTYGYGAYGDGVNAGSVTVDPFGKFAYVTNSGDVYDYGDSKLMAPSRCTPSTPRPGP